MKLNVGCSKHPMKGYINLDIMPYPETDVVCDATKLPFPRGTAEEIYAGHLLEHLEDPLGFFIESHRLLQEDGKLVIVVPDPTKSTTDDMMTVGTLFGFWLTNGKPDPSTPEGMHRSWWTFDLLRAIGNHLGFTYERCIDPWKEERLVIGADWHTGCVFKRGKLDRRMALAYTHYATIMEF